MTILHLRFCRFSLYIRNYRVFRHSPQLSSSSRPSSLSVTTTTLYWLGYQCMLLILLRSQNSSACQEFNQPQHSYIKAIFHSPHWLLGAASFMFRTFMEVFWICTRTDRSASLSLQPRPPPINFEDLFSI